PQPVQAHPLLPHHLRPRILGKHVLRRDLLPPPRQQRRPRRLPLLRRHHHLTPADDDHHHNQDFHALAPLDPPSFRTLKASAPIGVPVGSASSDPSSRTPPGIV